MTALTSLIRSDVCLLLLLALDDVVIPILAPLLKNYHLKLETAAVSVPQYHTTRRKITICTSLLPRPLTSRRVNRRRAARIHRIHRTVAERTWHQRRLCHHMSSSGPLHLSKCQRQRSRSSLIKVTRTRNGRSTMSHSQNARHHP